MGMNIVMVNVTNRHRGLSYSLALSWDFRISGLIYQILSVLENGFEKKMSFLIKKDLEISELIRCSVIFFILRIDFSAQNGSFERKNKHVYINEGF